MKDSLEGYSLLEDIKKANKKQDLRLLLGVLTGGTVCLTLGNLAIKGIDETDINYVSNITKSNLGISTVIASLIALRTKLISYRAKLRLESVVDTLEQKGVFVCVDSLKQANITPNSLSTEETKVTDIDLEDLRGNQVNLREYKDIDQLGEFNEVYLIDQNKEEHSLGLR